ncbi:MAG: thiamine pyrophosphate-binding protein, partial [Flavobacteriales bacterium]
MTSKNNTVLVSDLFAQLGGEFVVISPGSRNAPLIKCFQSFDSIQCVSIVDERSAAFFALGISLATKKPVALVCTSGTALLNYSPAIAEAYYLGVPLIVISADRPGIRIDKGEGQSIRQQNVYQNFQKGFLNIEEEHCFEKEIVEKSKNILLNAI